MLNLIIDIGNSFTKFAIFNHGDIMLKVTEKELSKEHVWLLKQEYAAINSVILSSVRDENYELLGWLNECFDRVIELNYKTPAPLINCYETPQTLGIDRFAAAVAAHQRFQNENILIIDAGTAITYDIVNHNGEYLGGTISIGMKTRYKALNQFTGKLPLLDGLKKAPHVAKNTTDAITSGVYHGLKGEVNQMINHYQQFWPDLKCIITGGDMKIIASFIEIDAKQEPDLTLWGLNIILDFQKKNE